MRIRTASQAATLVASLIVCGHVTSPRPAAGADPGPATPGPATPGPAIPGPASSPHHQPDTPSLDIFVTDTQIMPPAWFLDRVRLLLHQGRASEAHQLAKAAVGLYPHSAELRLGAGFAAMRSGQCQSAELHLKALHGLRLIPALQRRFDLLVAACNGPWRQHVVLGVSFGYRPSLVDRQRDVVVRLQPGSRLHGLCVRLAPLCNAKRPLVSRGQPDSGVDLWVDMAVRHLYRAGGAWNFDLETVLFQRRPRRPGFAGQGMILRVAARSQRMAGRQFHITAESGLSRFQQGRPDLTISQTHQRAAVGMSLTHSRRLGSYFGASRLGVTSRWLDLARTRYDYRLDTLLAENLTLSFGGGYERSRRTRRGMTPSSRARELSIGLRWSGRFIAVNIHHDRRHERFVGRLPFLAAPHQAHTRLTRLDLMTGDRLGWLNLKVVVSFEYRKISTPDPYRLPSSRTLMFRMSREFFSHPATR